MPRLVEQRILSGGIPFGLAREVEQLIRQFRLPVGEGGPLQIGREQLADFRPSGLDRFGVGTRWFAGRRGLGVRRGGLGGCRGRLWTLWAEGGRTFGEVAAGGGSGGALTTPVPATSRAIKAPASHFPDGEPSGDAFRRSRVGRRTRRDTIRHLRLRLFLMTEDRRLDGDSIPDPPSPFRVEFVPRGRLRSPVRFRRSGACPHAWVNPPLSGRAVALTIGCEGSGPGAPAATCPPSASVGR